MKRHLHHRVHEHFFIAFLRYSIIRAFLAVVHPTQCQLSSALLNPLFVSLGAKIQTATSYHL